MWGVFITFVFIYLTLPWRTAQQPTPVFLPGEFHGQKSLAGCSPWDRTESDTTEATAHACMHLLFSLSFWNREESDANKWEWEQRVETVSTPLVTWLFSMCVCVCAWVSHSLCPPLRDPMDCSLPSSSVHGICQARTLEPLATSSSPQGIFLTQLSNPCLLHSQADSLPLSHLGSWLKQEAN